VAVQVILGLFGLAGRGRGYRGREAGRNAAAKT
jgi:hypothetical protein